jgi:hypothetical protein
MTDFHGLPVSVLENKHLRLEYLSTAGPRIIGLSYNSSPNLFADMFEMTTDTPLGKYHFYGGHRLWISPETIDKTYIPDDSGLQITPVSNGVRLAGSREPVTGLHKSILVELEGDRPAVRLIHTISNESQQPLTFAPWALSMFRLGGTVILPQPVGNTDPHGLLSNRLMVLWPYTRINDPRLVLRDDCILLRANPAQPPVKLGYRNTAGWLACWLEGILFRKSYDVDPDAAYPDGGCNAETYTDHRFVELESLGPLVTLSPGMANTFTETWELYDTLDVPFIPQEVRELLKK